MRKVTATIIDCSKAADIKRADGSGLSALVMSIRIMFAGVLANRVGAIYLDGVRYDVDGKHIVRLPYHSLWHDREFESFVLNGLDLSQFGGRIPTITAVVIDLPAQPKAERGSITPITGG